MLVVSRRPGEAIIIQLPTGDPIEVTVLSMKGNQVKLGTDAPLHLPVVREELVGCKFDPRGPELFISRSRKGRRDWFACTQGV